MTTINDQPQHLLARYADRTGAKFEIQFREGAPYFETIGLTAELAILTHKIRLVLTEYGLPSHLKPYKDNPRIPGDGYRVPTGEDSCDQPHEGYNIEKWVSIPAADCYFCEMYSDYRLAASVPMPDWDEMTREDVPADAPAKLPRPQQQPQDDVQALKARVQELEGELDSAQEALRGLAYYVSVGGYNETEFGSADKWEAKIKEGIEIMLEPLKTQFAAASTPTLRPIAEMPAEVPEGCERKFTHRQSHGRWAHLTVKNPDSCGHEQTHFLDIRLPAPPDPDAELRREFGAWWESLQTKPPGKNELFIAFKAGRKS